MADNPHTKFKQVLSWLGGIFAAVGTACQLAGVTSMLLANIFLIFGVWILTGAELWFSQWVKKTGLYKNCVVATIISFAGCMTLIVSFEIANAKKHQEETVLGRSFMQMDKVVFRDGYSNVMVGSELQFNVFTDQHGPEPLHNVDGQGAVVMADDPGPTADLVVQKMFKKAISQVRVDIASGKRLGGDVGVGDGKWGTYHTNRLDQRDVEGLLNGHKRLYVLSWSTWADSRGSDEKYFCRWLQSPTSAHLEKTAVWRSCEVE